LPGQSARILRLMSDTQQPLAHFTHRRLPMNVKLL